jgi:hypothetical protein
MYSSFQIPPDFMVIFKYYYNKCSMLIAGCTAVSRYSDIHLFSDDESLYMRK